MLGVALLLVAALILRSVGAVLRVQGNVWPLRILGWIACTSGVWLVAGAVGAWFPWWPALVLGVLGALLEPLFPRRAMWSGADCVVAVSCGLLSIPAEPAWLVAATAGLVALAGALVDWLTVRIRSIRRRAIRTAPVAACIVAIVWIPAANLFDTFAGSIPGGFAYPDSVGTLAGVVRYSQLLNLGIVPVHEAERIVLDTGAVAWLERPAGSGPFPAAIYLHGNDSAGSMQASAVIMRRALVEAGFLVLAVDHPGYGESPAPAQDANLDAWDPLPTAQAALSYAHALPDVNGVIAIGHSMGCWYALRLANATPDLAGVLVFGSSVQAFERTDSAHWRYRYERFQSERNLPYRLDEATVEELYARYYETDPAALKSDHPLFVFVQFGYEWPDIMASRAELYESAPGPKLSWTLANSTHYFTSSEKLGLVVGDTRVTHRLVALLRAVAAAMPDGLDAAELDATSVW